MRDADNLNDSERVAYIHALRYLQVLYITLVPCRRVPSSKCRHKAGCDSFLSSRMNSLEEATDTTPKDSFSPAGEQTEVRKLRRRAFESELCLYVQTRPISSGTSQHSQCTYWRTSRPKVGHRRQWHLKRGDCRGSAVRSKSR